MRATRLDEPVFKELGAAGGSDLISVLLPTHKRGRDISQDRIRLKNQLAEADETLTELGWKPRQRSDRLAKAHQLLDDVDFWEHQEAGLAVYIDDDGDIVPVSTVRSLTTASFVMPVFMLRPLAADLNVLTLPVLALTRDEVGLFAATEIGADEITADLPSYEDVNWFVDREKERQHHPDMVGSESSRHGHEPSARRDEDVARFLREVDAALEGFDKETPLIVLGDDDLVSRFADVADRPTLSPFNSGIRAPFSSREIVDNVGALIAEVDQQRIDKARARVEEQLALETATADIKAALPAAVEGRVGLVLINRNAPPVWGRLNELTYEAELHEGQKTGDVDLLDRLVVWARDNGAEVVATDSTINDRPFIAAFRY